LKMASPDIPLTLGKAGGEGEGSAGPRPTIVGGGRPGGIR